MADRYLRVICLEAFTYNLFTQFGATLLVLYALDDLGLSAAELGIYVGLGGLGAVTGSVTLRQSVAPEHFLARVNAVMRLASYSALPVGALLAGAIASATSVRTALFAGAAGLALPVLILLCSPVPRLRTAFDAQPATSTPDPLP